MKISTLLSYANGFKQATEDVVELEKAGLDMVWVPEAYSFDAPSAMGYLAAKTQRVTIASGIVPIYTRTATLLAMTAAGIDDLSDGRCMLGLGASGPQVIEGFHGVPYQAPATRLAEVIEVCRKVWAREKINFQGKQIQIPLPSEQGTGLGKPLKLINHPQRADIPIAVASLGLKSVEYTAKLANAWLPAFYHPAGADKVWGEALRRGQVQRDPSLAPLDVFAGGLVGIGDGLESLRNLTRPQMALYIGGMGAKEKNFYNQIFRQYGYETEADEIQTLYLAGNKKAAEAAIPQNFIDETSLIGPPGFVKERLLALRESGVTSLNVGFVGQDLKQRLQQCERLKNLLETL